MITEIVSGLVSGLVQGHSPTYYQDIRPILADKCIVCHYEGGPSPFSLETFDLVRRRAALIQTVAMTNVMPPTDALSDLGRIAKQDALTSEELIAIQKWVRQGTQKGEEGEAVEPRQQAERVDGTLLLRPTVAAKVRSSGAPFWLSLRIPWSPKEDTLVKSFVIRPRAPFAVRQVLLARDDYELGAKRGAFETYGSMGIDANAFIGAWSPGYFDWHAPGGSGVLVRKGQNLIAQVLYVPTGKEEDGGFDLDLSTEKAAGSQRIARWMSMGTTQLTIPWRLEFQTFSFTRRLSRDVVVSAIVPEARAIATQIRLTAALPSGESKTVFKIGSWDRNWMGAYNFEHAVKLPKGTILKAEIDYDNADHSSFDPNVKTPTVHY